MIRFVCPVCQAAMEAASHQAGQKTNCLKCGQLLQIPAETILARLYPSDAIPLRQPRTDSVHVVEKVDEKRIVQVREAPRSGRSGTPVTRALKIARTVLVVAVVLYFIGRASVGDDDLAARVVVLAFMITGIIAIYFLPAFVAFGRGHHQAVAIFALNIFGGWTLVGWVISLVWACTAIDTRENTQRHSY